MLLPEQGEVRSGSKSEELNVGTSRPGRPTKLTTARRVATSLMGQHQKPTAPGLIMPEDAEIYILSMIDEEPSSDA